MHLHSRRTARAVAALTGAVLLLGMAPGAPAGARSADGPADGPGLGWSELQDLAADLQTEAGPGGASSGSVRSPARRVVVKDRRGDVLRSGPTPASERARAPHADLTQVAYRTPARRDGDLRVTARWADLRDARRPGVRRQHLLTFIEGARPEEAWVMWVGNARTRVHLFDLSAASAGAGRIRPAEVSVKRTHGPGGRLSVTMSTEWLDEPWVRFTSLGLSGEALDETRRTGWLDVGPLRR